MENIHTTEYRPPVDTLLTYGECEPEGPSDWPNYLELGFGSEHILDLIRMATDENLNEADSNSLEVWAPIHAWHALGQLRAEAAAEPLLALFDFSEDSDWVTEDLPDVFGMIGPAALPGLAAYIADDVSNNDTSRIDAISSVEKIGQHWPDARSQCIEVLTRQLELLGANEPDVNGFLIGSLVDLQAIEAVPLIERAFALGCVDLTIMGDWDHVQVELGLKSPQEIQQKRHRFFPEIDRLLTAYKQKASRSVSSHVPYEHKTDHKKPKSQKSKMIKQSRKKNRKRS